MTALDDISLSIEQGELIAITGASGSGKTTLTHIIGGLITPDKGEILVDNTPLKKRSDRALSNYRNTRVGFVFQNFSLIPHYSCVENVGLPMIVSGAKPHARRERALELLRAVGLEKRANQHADKLSGGERQRVSIARALAASPEIIIADEPTGSLDSTRGGEIMAILEKLNRTQQITVIIVTHDNSLADRAGRTIELRDGKLVTRRHHANR